MTNLMKVREGCTTYFQSIISNIDAPYSKNLNTPKTLSNLIFKGRFVAASDRENVLGCFRRKEKLAKK